MKLIVGLGNPGEEYAATRHNIGFDVVEALANSQQQIANSSFQFNKPLQSELTSITIDRQEVLLVKPHTFMNNSGLAVKKILESNQKSTIDDLIVVHDDISLDLGQIKISKGAGAGKHNGVQSIIDHLKSKDFIRIRCGIGRGDGILSDVVLSKFSQDEKLKVEKMIHDAVAGIILITTDGLEKAMGAVNQKTF